MVNSFSFPICSTRSKGRPFVAFLNLTEPKHLANAILDDIPKYYTYEDYHSHMWELVTATRYIQPQNSKANLRFAEGIVESFESEGTFKGHLTQLPCNAQGHLQVYEYEWPTWNGDLYGIWHKVLCLYNRCLWALAEAFVVSAQECWPMRL